LLGGDESLLRKIVLLSEPAGTKVKRAEKNVEKKVEMKYIR